MKQLGTPLNTQPLERTINVEMTLAEVALIHSVLGPMSTPRAAELFEAKGFHPTSLVTRGSGLDYKIFEEAKTILNNNGVKF